MKTLSPRILAPIFLSVLIITGQLAGQDTARPKKLSTPEQKELQARFKSYLAHREVLQKQAMQAFYAEASRGKAGDCKNADNTRAAEICLETESDITEKNYAAFTGAIRELLSLADPSSGQPSASGPSGTPPDAADRALEFDNLQNAWRQYRKIGTSAAYNQYKGGTLAPVSSIEMDQQLVRSHMQELNSIYDGPLHR